MLENPATVSPLLLSFRETGLPVTTFTTVSQKVVLWAAGGARERSIKGRDPCVYQKSVMFQEMGTTMDSTKIHATWSSVLEWGDRRKGKHIFRWWYRDWWREARIPTWLSGKEPTCQCRRPRRRGFDPRVRKIPWRRKWQPTQVGKSHGQRSLGSPQLSGWARSHVRTRVVRQAFLKETGRAVQAALTASSRASWDCAWSFQKLQETGVDWERAGYHEVRSERQRARSHRATWTTSFYESEMGKHRNLLSRGVTWSDCQFLQDHVGHCIKNRLKWARKKKRVDGNTPGEWGWGFGICWEWRSLRPICQEVSEHQLQGPSLGPEWALTVCSYGGRA